ncbi:hypothetical protein GLOIN_2v1789077 [Rhizophagus clarus]|uniref:CCHC-type domain-containing protein n=1 Tax=Rhizophagus clarus TaxID=94130 RepID=A0A8H3L2K2_9GLOM|nr:hypothetical protein GLOIN_2v1789077 [Rhizophagus clarus]
MNASSSIPVFLAANPYVDTNRSGSGMTKNKIEDLIKPTMASSQPQQNTDLQAIAKSFQETMSRATKTLDNTGMILNNTTINAIKSAVRSAVKKCTKCGRFGHTSHKCSVKKKRKSKKSKKSKVNLTIEPDSDSFSDSTSSSDSSDSDTNSSDSSDSDSDLNIHIAKSKKK